MTRTVSATTEEQQEKAILNGYCGRRPAWQAQAAPVPDSGRFNGLRIRARLLSPRIAAGRGLLRMAAAIMSTIPLCWALLPPPFSHHARPSSSSHFSLLQKGSWTRMPLSFSWRKGMCKHAAFHDAFNEQGPELDKSGVVLKQNCDGALIFNLTTFFLDDEIEARRIEDLPAGLLSRIQLLGMIGQGTHVLISRCEDDISACFQLSFSKPDVFLLDVWAKEHHLESSEGRMRSIFMTKCLESLSLENNLRRIVVSQPQEELLRGVFKELGFEPQSGDKTSYLVKRLKGHGGPRTLLGRNEVKGSAEELDVISLQGSKICTMQRRFVEQYNLLHSAVGILVHNKNGQIYVHRRSAQKSMHALHYDMFVGGLLLSGEAPIEGARSHSLFFPSSLTSGCRNEVREELGIGRQDLEEESSDAFGLQEGEDEIKFNDGEVIWGKFMSLVELEEMIQKENFVPGGLKAWQETVERGFHDK
eukprot:719722-Hanusia_phi.AAC.1